MGKGGEEEVKRSQERRLAPARVEGEAPVIVAGDDEERGCVASVRVLHSFASANSASFWTGMALTKVINRVASIQNASRIMRGKPSAIVNA